MGLLSVLVSSAHPVEKQTSPICMPDGGLHFGTEVSTKVSLPQSQGNRKNGTVSLDGQHLERAVGV